MSYSYGVGGATAALGAVGLCKNIVLFTSPLFLTMWQIYYSLEMEKLSMSVFQGLGRRNSVSQGATGGRIHRERVAVRMGKHGHRSLHWSISGWGSMVCLAGYTSNGGNLIPKHIGASSLRAPP